MKRTSGTNTKKWENNPPPRTIQKNEHDMNINAKKTITKELQPFICHPQWRMCVHRIVRRTSEKRDHFTIESSVFVCLSCFICNEHDCLYMCNTRKWIPLFPTLSFLQPVIFFWLLLLLLLLYMRFFLLLVSSNFQNT